MTPWIVVSGDPEHGDGRRGRDDSNGIWRAATPSCFDGRVRHDCGRRQSFLDLQPRVADVAQAMLAIFRQAAPHQPLDDRRQFARQRGPVRIAREDRRHRIRCGVAGERCAASEHLVQHAAERPDVGAFVDGLPPRLLRTHVRRGPEDHTGDGVGRARTPVARSRVAIGCRRLQGFRQTEVENLDGPIRTHFHIGWLQIAMDDSCLMGGFKRFRDLLSNAQRLIDGNRPERNSMGQVRSCDQFHDDRSNAVGPLEPIDDRDVRVIQRSQDFCFALEAGQPFGVRGQRRRQDFNGDIAFQVWIGSSVHLTHAAGTDLGGDLIPAEARAGTEGHDSLESWRNSTARSLVNNVRAP
jgi:hypothetical protein